MALTVAAIQMAMVDDVDANVATAERLVREAAAEGRPARPHPRAVRGPLLLQGHAARALRPGPPGRRPPDGRALPRRRRRARRRAAAEHLRAGQPRHATTRVVIVDADGAVLGTYRKSHIPDGPGYTEKYYFNPGDTGLPGVADAARRRRRRHLLGPVVPRVGAVHGAARRRGAVLPDGDRHRAARPAVGLERSLAAGDAGSRRRQPHAAGRRQPHRPRASARRPRSRSTARRSSPTPPATRSPRPAATARRC